ncbi:TetR/AcrR family transcriptional regulator [Microbacterium pseudoresistens]|uniref:AcrR family transcriptional regulator n=1 Tax=Microbacterium pseudoresistens TaxID=640634 RepID=A0A7Y9EWJ4_9MICO|nr:TetR/AcrR family transcriptional regulator [Microbacterium pseudoresistens]NYD55233.1 AcrR family transcriptional regulator [Microbacterium pseudoresistens]
MSGHARQRAERREVAESREKILAAAETYFAERTIDAPLNELARRAGVSPATFYRRFPTGADLIRALYDRFAARFDELFASIHDTASGWEQLGTAITGTIAIVRDSPILLPVMVRMMEIDPAHRPGERWVAPIEQLTARAKEEGMLRTDVTGYDLALTPLAIASLGAFPPPISTVLLDRLHGILLDGLQAPSPTPLTGGGTVEAEAFHNAMHRNRSGDATRP